MDKHATWISRKIDMITNHHNSMKCCPKDKVIKKEWIDRLESESNNISNDRVNEISNFCYVFSHSLRLKIALLLNKVDLCVCEWDCIDFERKTKPGISPYFDKEKVRCCQFLQSKYKYYMIEGDATDFLSVLSDKMII